MEKTFKIEKLHSGFILTVGSRKTAVEKLEDVRKEINQFVYDCTLRLSASVPTISIKVEETDNPPTAI